MRFYGMFLSFLSSKEKELMMKLIRHKLKEVNRLVLSMC